MIIGRWIAWTALGAVVVLSLVPVGLRPVSALPHMYEHFTAFLLVGLAFGMAYPGQQLTIGLASVPTAATIELLQLFVPGRHARVSDFVVNAAGACVGLALASVITRIRQLT
jgi:VanZ family protein